MDEKGVYVYVVDQADGTYVKIGVARDLPKRLRGLRCGNPQELAVHFTILFPTRAEAERVERVAHGLLKGRRAAGEWFSCPAKDAKAAVLRASAGGGVKGPAQPFYRGNAWTNAMHEAQA